MRAASVTTRRFNALRPCVVVSTAAAQVSITSRCTMWPGGTQIDAMRVVCAEAALLITSTPAAVSSDNTRRNPGCMLLSCTAVSEFAAGNAGRETRTSRGVSALLIEYIFV